MKLLFFGAGASYGSGPVVPYAPPLGAGLFGKLAEFEPSVWKKLPPDVQRTLRVDFEAGMSALWSAGSHQVSLTIRSMSKYFAAFRLQLGNTEANTYRALLNGLVGGNQLAEVIFSTLNYECLLEFSVVLAGRQVVYHPSMLGPRGSLILKPHGSCNWIVEGISIAPTGVTSAPGVSFAHGAPVTTLEPRHVAAHVDGDGVPPILSVFMEGKPVQTNPPFVAEIQTIWGDMVRRADAVGIIGVRPHPADAHIWTPLAETSARLVVIGNEAEYRQWADAAGRSANLDVVGSRFTPALPAFLESFLR